MPMSLEATVVVGIDVGGSRKGYHAVALEGGTYQDRLASLNVDELTTWCVETMRAAVIAVDAPCRWRQDGEVRLAERELTQRRIRCFTTPTSEVAHRPHPTGYYDWMLRGEALYESLNRTHPLCREWPARGQRYCFETFPHAITWQLRGGNASAKEKLIQRRKLLADHRIATRALDNIDWIDAALCALTAQMAADRVPLIALGEERTGMIIVPAKSRRSECQ